MKWLKKSRVVSDRCSDRAEHNASSDIARDRVQANEKQPWVALYALAETPIAVGDLMAVLAPLGFERSAQHHLVCHQADVPIKILNVMHPGTFAETHTQTCRGVVILMATTEASPTMSHAFSTFLACVDTLKTLATFLQFGESPQQLFDTPEAWDQWVVNQRQKLIDLESLCQK